MASGVFERAAIFGIDQFAAPGTAKLAMNMLDEGTKTRSSLQINDELARLGAALDARSDLDSSSVHLLALKENLEPSLDIYSDVILNPAFPEADFRRLQQQQLAAIQREKSEPNALPLRIVPRLLFGPGHAYNIPFTGSGIEGAVAGLTRADLQKFYDTWFKPNNSTLIDRVCASVLLGASFLPWYYYARSAGAFASGV